MGAGDRKSVSHDVTLWTSRMMALVCSAATAIYTALEIEPSPVIVLILIAGPLIAVILWLQKDAQRTRTAAVLDWGLFLWVAWPVVIPWYAWRTRGLAGWRLALGLVAMILSPYIAGASVPWLVYGVRYAVWYFGTSE